MQTFISQHYVGPDMETRYKTGEAWKKVLGPVFIYLNSDSTRNNLQHLLWEDAKRQVYYSFVIIFILIRNLLKKRR